MPRWLCWWGEQDEQAEVNVAELLEQVDRQRAIIEEQARQIKKLHDWIDQVPKTHEVTE
jgi:archaellum component FlaC